MQALQQFPCKTVSVSSLSDHSDTVGTTTYLRDINNENVAIAERLKAHDPAILDELILRYQRRLLRYLIHLTADRALSEDLLQETWIRVLTRGSQFNGDSQVVTWLLSIARNLVFDLRRRRAWSLSLESMTADDNERPLEVPSTEKSPFETFARRENAHLLADALGGLSPKQRKIVELRYHREMSLDEIAETTGTSLSAVKSRLYRALAVLRPRLKAALSSRSEAVQLAS
jgi:RNA polymerase sigma-70 factor (ECF subfamily)